MQKALVDLKTGQSGVIVGINGGHGLKSQLEKFGIRAGKGITKVSGIFNQGPVTIQLDNCQVAIGHGKASRILLEVQDNAENSSDR